MKKLVIVTFLGLTGVQALYPMAYEVSNVSRLASFVSVPSCDQVMATVDSIASSVVTSVKNHLIAWTSLGLLAGCWGRYQYGLYCSKQYKNAREYVVVVQQKICELNYPQDRASAIAHHLLAHARTVKDVRTLLLHYLIAIRPGTGASHEQAMQAMKDCDLGNSRYGFIERFSSAAQDQFEHEQIMRAMDWSLKDAK